MFVGTIYCRLEYVFQCVLFFFFQAEDGIRDVERSRGLGDVYKRQKRTTRVSNPVRYPRSRASASVSAW